MITDFFDQVKSRSKGYASMEYQILGWRDQDLVRLDIKINGEDAPPLSTVCHRDQAHQRGKGEGLVCMRGCFFCPGASERGGVVCMHVFVCSFVSVKEGGGLVC